MNIPSPNRWAKLWRHVSAEGDAQPGYTELLARYSEPQRHYHNLQHLAECLVEFDSAHHLAKDPVAVELATWFHDAVYDPHAPDNEERSSELARERILQGGGATELSRSVSALILATKSHDAALHRDAPLLVDVDLSILGQPTERFQDYECKIRREYEWVSEEAFAAKRAEILSHFLRRTRIYTNELFFSKYEERARTNLQNSITKLTRR